MKKNLLLLWLRDALAGVSGAFGSAAVIQGFLLHAGMSESLIGIYVTFGAVVNFAVSPGLSGMAAATSRTVRYSSLCYMLTGLFGAAYIIPAMIKTGASGLFVYVMIVTALSNTAVALRTIFEYKLPCEVIDVDGYAAYISVSGVISGLTGLGSGILVTMLYKNPDFNKTSALVFAVSSAALLAAGIINGFLKVIHPCTPPKTDKNRLFGQLGRLFADRDFRILLFPNFIRGFGAAIVSLAALLAVKTAGFTDAQCAIISTLASVGTLVSCAVYMPMIKLFGRALTSFLGAAAFCLTVPAFLSGSRPLFIVLYGVAYTGYNVTCNAIPDLIYRHVPPELISPFQTWRLALLTLGTTAGTSLFGFLLTKVPPVVILVAGTAGYFICGTSYFLFYRKRPPVAPVNETFSG